MVDAEGRGRRRKTHRARLGLIFVLLASTAWFGFFSEVQATSYEKTLPSTAILFDGFEDTAVNWAGSRDTVERQAEGIISRNTTVAYDGAASLFVENPVSSSIETAARAFTYGNQSRIGFALRWTYNDAMRTAPGFPNYDFFVQAWDGGHRYNCGVMFSPGVGSPSSGVISITTPVSTTYVHYAPYPAYNDTRINLPTNNWNWIKLTVDISTKTFVKLEDPSGIFNLTQSCLSTPDARPADMNVIRVGVALNTDANTPPMEVNIDDVLVTDETVSASPVQFGFVPSSSGFTLIIVAMAIAVSGSFAGMWNTILRRRLRSSKTSEQSLQ